VNPSEVAVGVAKTGFNAGPDVEELPPPHATNKHDKTTHLTFRKNVMALIN
jgi:hypothetical protein